MNILRALVVVLFMSFIWLIPSPAAAAPPHRSEPVRTVDVASDSVNINTADVKELMKLEGIGRKVAEKIIEYREHHGLFQKAEEIRKVEGIGSGLWERNRTRIVIK